MTKPSLVFGVIRAARRPVGRLCLAASLVVGCEGTTEPRRDRSLGDFALVAIGEPGESYAVAGFNNAGAIAGRLFASSGPDRAFRHLGAGFDTLDLGTT